jgi:hypothetical protein
MKTNKLFNIFALVFLCMALVAVGCGGQRSTTEEPEEAVAPEAALEEPAAEPEAVVDQEPAVEEEAAAEPVPQPAPKPKPAPKPAPASKPEPTPSPETAAKAEPAPVPESKPEPAPAAEPEPAPESKPTAEPIEVTVPAGTIMAISFLDPLSSKTSQVGQTFRTSVTQDVVLVDKVVIPAGSILSGTVTEAVPLKKIGGKAKLALDFTAIELPTGEIAPIKATFAEEGKSETKKDTATIGGATAGGALLGRILGKKDKKKATIIGAILGAAAGTVIASKTEGEEVEIPVGSPMNLQLTEPAKVHITP